MRLLAVLTALSFAISASPAHAGWGRTPVGAPAVTALGDQHRPLAIPDGAGGAFLVFADLRSGGYDIYAQRINRAGNREWDSGGVPVCSAPGLQELPEIVSDGQGGVIITWEDHRSTGFDIYAQRLDGTGLAQWAADGVLVCGANGDQVDPALCSDGAGGAYVAWTDFRGGLTSDVYAQRLDATGAALLASDGISLSSAALDQDSPKLAADGAGGAFAVWNDFRNGANSDLYMAHLTGAGALPLGANGVVLSSGTGDQISPVVAADAAGGAFVAWSDTRWGNSDIFAQRISSAGVRLWHPNGDSICVASNDQAFPAIAHDGANGLFVVWEDARSNNDNVYAHHVDSTGYPIWQNNGVPVCAAAGAQLEPQVVRDTTGGIIVCWQDARGANVDIYAQRLDLDAQAVWAHDGLPLCNFAAHQIYPTMVPDGTGGAIVVWEDTRNLIVDLYAQRILDSGVLGSSEPVISAITDVPDDAGLRVNVTWQASLFEAPVQQIDRYRMWRRAPGGEWALVDSIAPTQNATYSLIGHTTADSTPDVTTLRTAFRIDAVSTDGLMTWTSAADSGLSIDSVPPETPVGFLVLWIAPGVATATWVHVTAPDWLKYRVYFGTTSYFEPDRFTFRHTAYGTRWTGDVEPGTWIKLTAADIHGNESEAAFAFPEITTGTDDVRPSVAFLGPASPNPMRASSTLRFGLTRESEVSMRVYDQQGRQVCVLASGVLPAGQHAAVWTGRDERGNAAAPGVYFVRAKIEGREFTQRVVRVR